MAILKTRKTCRDAFKRFFFFSISIISQCLQSPKWLDLIETIILANCSLVVGKIHSKARASKKIEFSLLSRFNQSAIEAWSIATLNSAQLISSRAANSREYIGWVHWLDYYFLPNTNHKHEFMSSIRHYYDSLAHIRSSRGSLQRFIACKLNFSFSLKKIFVWTNNDCSSSSSSYLFSSLHDYSH